MSTNCLITKLKSSVNNDELDFLGYVKYEIDLTTASANFAPQGLRHNGKLGPFMPGAFLADNKTFANGKNKLETESDSAELVAGDKYTIFVPKYSYPVIAPSYEPTVWFSMDLDNLKFIEGYHQASDDWGTTMYFTPDKNGNKSKGNFEYLCDILYPTVMRTLILSRSDIEIDMSTSNISKLCRIQALYINYNNNVTGNIRTYLTNFSTLNKDYLIARTDTMSIRLENTPNLGKDVFYASNLIAINLTFNGTKDITIQTVNTSGTPIKTFNYDISTDTLVEQS